MISQRTYLNLPTQKSLDVYDQTRREFVQTFEGSQNIAGIVEFGTVTAPGVSDLDLMLLVKKNAQIPIKLIQEAKKKPAINDLIGAGTILTLPVEIFKDIRKVDNFGSFQFLSGKEIETTKISPEKRIDLSSVALFDWLPERLMRIHKIYVSPQLDVINSLCLLHSLNYSFDNLVTATDFEHDDLAQYRLTLHELRTNWHNIKNNIALLELTICNGLKIIHDGVKHFAEYSKYKIYKSNLVQGKNECHNIQIQFHHSLLLNFTNTAHKLTTEEFIKNPILPIDFVNHYATMTSFSLPLTKLIQQQVFGDSRVNLNTEIMSSGYYQALKEKVHWLNKNYQFLKQNKVKVGMVRYGNFINATKSI